MPKEEEGVKPTESPTVEKDEASREVPQPGSSERVTAEKPVEQEAKIQPEAGKNVEKLEEQIANLNTALKQERDSKQSGTKESNERIGKLEKQLEESQGIITKLQGVFTPEEKKEEPKYITQSELNEILDKQKKEIETTSTQKQQEEAINKEIKSMEAEWDGKGGKPKYIDQEVLEWQRENALLHLSPKQAFIQKNHNEIIDWEVKQRMSKDTRAENVEQPSGAPSEHETDENIPKTDKELQSAILEAMEKADSEM